MIYTHKFINIQVIWFESKTKIDKKTDMVIYRQVDKKTSKSDVFYTLIIDLKKSQEEIYQEFSKSNRKEIRKAINIDKIVYKMYNKDITEELLSSFLEAQHKFSNERGLGEITKSEFMGYYKSGKLYISTVAEENGEVISWRVHIVEASRARALVSNSFFKDKDNSYRNLVGRASRLMRMNDILYFKSIGVAVYDFGGWYAGDEDQKKLAINKYKEGFANIKDIRYNYSRCVTIKCYIFKILVFIKGNLLK